MRPYPSHLCLYLSRDVPESANDDVLLVETVRNFANERP